MNHGRYPSFVLSALLATSLLAPLDTLGRFCRFTARMLTLVPSRGWSFSELLEQAGTLIARCFIPVCATIFPFGAVIGVLSAWVAIEGAFAWRRVSPVELESSAAQS